MYIVLIPITITVAGTKNLQYLTQLIICPDFAETEVPTTFALAPIGVALPPISVRGILRPRGRARKELCSTNRSCCIRS